MALTDFQEHFDNAYQEVFQKVLVAKEVMNTRFEPVLKYGESVERFAYDIDDVKVRTVTRGAASTIDTITDSSELLEINLEKEAVFHISDGEVKQAGPLNPGEVIGGKIARKVAIDLDARCFGEVVNADETFDTGDLTTLASNGTPITLSSTTVPQLVTRAPAKLRRKNNQEIMSNMALVVDSYGASDIAQYLLGKDIDLAAAVFKNGYTDVVSNARMYVTENLTGEATIDIEEGATADEVLSINGVTFTAKATPANPGEFDVVGTADAQGEILANAINGAATGKDSATGYFEVSEADRDVLDNAGIVATYDADTDVLTIVGTGSGRLTISSTLSSGVTTNFIHAYFGKIGSIDLVVQDLKEVDMRKTDDRRGTNVFSSYLAGLKTFSDGAKKFLDLHIKA